MSGPGFRRGNTKTMRKKGGIEEGERVFFFKYVVEEKRIEKERERERVNE